MPPLEPTAPPALDQAVSTLGAHYADLWRAVDALIAQIGPADWSRRHGEHWTVADVPFHLA